MLGSGLRLVIDGGLEREESRESQQAQMWVDECSSIVVRAPFDERGLFHV